jgi:hypothetical protein
LAGFMFFWDLTSPHFQYPLFTILQLPPWFFTERKTTYTKKENTLFRCIFWKTNRNTSQLHVLNSFLFSIHLEGLNKIEQFAVDSASVETNMVSLLDHFNRLSHFSPYISSPFCNNMQCFVRCSLTLWIHAYHLTNCVKRWKSTMCM